MFLTADTIATVVKCWIRETRSPRTEFVGIWSCKVNIAQPSGLNQVLLLRPGKIKRKLYFFLVFI